MDYNEWAREYYENAQRVHKVIVRKNQELKDKKALSADRRKQLTDEISHYRRIYHELLNIGDTLRNRAEGAAIEE